MAAAAGASSSTDKSGHHDFSDAGFATKIIHVGQVRDGRSATDDQAPNDGAL